MKEKRRNPNMFFVSVVIAMTASAMVAGGALVSVLKADAINLEYFQGVSDE